MANDHAAQSSPLPTKLPHGSEADGAPGPGSVGASPPPDRSRSSRVSASVARQLVEPQLGANDTCPTTIDILPSYATWPKPSQPLT